MKKITFQFVAMLLVIGLSACGGRHHHDAVTTTAAQAPAPVLSFLPSSGPVGTLVTLSGTDFTGATSVSIGGVAAIVVNKSTTDLTAMVMPGAISGSVNYTDATGTTTISGTFAVGLTGVPATQQAKLVAIGQTGAGAGPNGGGANAPAQQGYSVAVSADGNTAVVGGPYDQSDAGVANTGAAWVYTRDNTGAWTQQAKLVDPNAVGGTCTVGVNGSCQGWSVAVSADGNTAVVGGPGDSNSAGTSAGAAWVWTRSGTTWTQQSKLIASDGFIASDGSSNTRQGWSVAVSADGNTAVVGGDNDTNSAGTSAGAAWVWTRSGTTWTQQQAKLVGTGGAAGAQQGYSVALSADGNTAVVGGPYDYDSATASYVGAAWVWTRSGTTWTQQSKLVGTGAVAPYVFEGWSVAVSADGNTAMVGGPYDNSGNGAAWVFTRSGTTWTQQTKLFDTNATGASWQGYSAALSADGSTTMVGGPGDSSNVGAAWTYIP